MADKQNGDIYKSVQDHYSSMAKASGLSNEKAIAEHFGYNSEDLTPLPEGSNLGLSCGNPLAIALLIPGETVIDFGSGAGFDVFQAARKVGRGGKAIGVDQNDDMLARANRNLESAKVDSVSFLKSPITDIALPDGQADCIISNCVVNLVPEDEKPAVFKEMFRLLKPGGRVAISDILAKKEMPDQIRRDMALYVGCVAGASQLNQYDAYLRDAGFEEIMIADTQRSINVYKTENEGCQSCCVPSSKGDITQPEVDFDEWAGSFKIFARKRI